jgi:hypothetical protein
VDAATVGAVFSGLVGLIGAIAALLKIYWTRPQMPVAEEILERQSELETELLALAAWAHDAAMIAAANGIDLPEPPDSIRLLGRRTGEPRHRAHGWRASVKAQTGEQPAVRPDDTRRLPPAGGPDTWPERRRPPLPKG